MSDKLHYRISDLGKEVDDFEDLLFRQKYLYEEIRDIGQEKFPHVSRDDAKIFFYRYVFGKRCSNPAKTLFQKRFPAIDQYINGIKQTFHHAVLAQILQQMEAAFIINTVVPHLRQDARIHLLTQHDSILAPVQYQDQLRESIQYGFREWGIPDDMYGFKTYGDSEAMRF